MIKKEGVHITAQARLSMQEGGEKEIVSKGKQN